METPDMGKMTLLRVMDAGGGRVPSGMPRALLTMLPRPSSLGQTNRAQSRCTTQCNTKQHGAGKAGVANG